MNKLEGFLAAELEQTTCPICFELMVAPVHAPTLIFPCGHTFCVKCLESHIKANGRRTCPFCRQSIQSQAPNMLMQQLIDGYVQKKGLGPTKAAHAARLDEVSDAGPLGGGDDDRDVEEYRRQWRMLSMRWRIYENEERDCAKDLEEKMSKLSATRMVKKHLHQEKTDVQVRLKDLQDELDLILDQLSQQASKETQMEEDVVEKRRQFEMVAATKGTLEDERSKIRLLVSHYIKNDREAELFLES